MNAAALNRRRFLRGMGAVLALPSLEAFLPRAVAATATGRAIATTASGAPLRMAFLYFPNGAIQSHWTAEGAGADFKLANTLEPLQALKHRVQVISGLEHLNAEPGNDGAGDHARANGTFLTGVRVKKTAGSGPAHRSRHALRLAGDVLRPAPQVRRLRLRLLLRL
jgi:hypothetical protein